MVFTILQQGSLCRISLDYEIHSNHIEDLLDMVHGSFKTSILENASSRNHILLLTVKVKYGSSYFPKYAPSGETPSVAAARINPSTALAS